MAAARLVTVDEAVQIVAEIFGDSAGSASAEEVAALVRGLRPSLLWLVQHLLESLLAVQGRELPAERDAERWSAYLCMSLCSLASATKTLRKIAADTEVGECQEA